MSSRALRASVCVLAVSIAVLGGDTPERKKERIEQRKKEKQIDQRDKAAGGILVSEPKVYDDYLLQQMLYAAEARLASMQVLDASSISGKLGAVSGGRQTINGLAINAQTPSIPAVSTVANGATGSTVNTTNAGVPTTSVTTSGLPATNVTTAAPAFGPPTATVPAATTSLPSTIGPSSSNILNEQMQLTYEIANLRLLLEGSLSDRMLKSATIKAVKPRTTIGFSIALTPQYKSAAAIVEVEVESANDMGDPEPPAVTALLPREKTYNVASIRESSLSIGAGAVTQVFGISGSFLHGSKSYYVVQDQDTVALTLPVDKDEETKKTRFLWQFRPVLGQNYVSAGLKQTFVQLAFPTDFGQDSFGRVSVTTYWRDFNKDTGVLGNVIKGSLHNQVSQAAIPNFKPFAGLSGFSPDDMEDMGNSQMLVKPHGHFLSGTTVRIGSTILPVGPGGIVFTNIGFEFTASISDLANRGVYLVARDGSEFPLVIPHELKPKVDMPAPEIANVAISAVDETNSLVSVTFKDAMHLTADNPPLVLVIGNRVFGYSDAPFLPSDTKSLRAIVPTALLTANATLVVKPLFGPPGYAANWPLNLSPFAQTERIVLLSQGKDSSTFLLYGSRLASVSVLSPAGVTPLDTPDKDTLRQFTLTADQITASKQILIQRTGERPILVPLPSAGGGASPSPSPAASGSAQQINVNATLDVERGAALNAVEQAPAQLNADQAVFTGNNLSDLQAVSFAGKPITFQVSKDGKSVTLKGLKASQVTAAATTQLLQFTYKAAMVPVKLDIVDK